MNPIKQQKTNLIIGRALRYTLFTGVMFGVYSETGLWTTLCLVLIFAEGELKSHLFHGLAESVQWLASVTMRLVQKHQEAQDEDSKED